MTIPLQLHSQNLSIIKVRVSWWNCVNLDKTESLVLNLPEPNFFKIFKPFITTITQITTLISKPTIKTREFLKVSNKNFNSFNPMEVKRNLISKFKSLKKMMNKSSTDSNKCGTWSKNNKLKTSSPELNIRTSGEDHHQQLSITLTKVKSKIIKKKPNKPQWLIKKSLKNIMLLKNISILSMKTNPPFWKLFLKSKLLNF